MQFANRRSSLREGMRRESSLTPGDCYLKFMLHAKQVCDEEEVYLSMEEENIGTGEGEYWLARFEVMKNKCQYVQLVKQIAKVKALPNIHQDYLIRQFQKTLENEMMCLIKTQMRSRKRTVAEYEKFSFASIQKATRIIGGTEIYVDESSRLYYNLEDYSEFIQNNLKEYCLKKKRKYLDNQRTKPLSYLGEKQNKLKMQCDELTAKNTESYFGRKSDRNSLASHRNSLIRLSNKFNIKNAETFQTPKAQLANMKNVTYSDIENQNKNGREERQQKNRRDSVQILRSMIKSIPRQKHETGAMSPCFGENPEQLKASFSEVDLFEELIKDLDKAQSIQANYQEPSATKEHPRTGTEIKEQFSFGKNLEEFRENKDLELEFLSDMEVQPIQGHSSMVSQSDENLNNVAILIGNSFSFPSNAHPPRKDDIELDLLLRESQAKTYSESDCLEFKTLSSISDIDSNQENHFTCSESIKSAFEAQIFQPGFRERKMFTELPLPIQPISSKHQSKMHLFETTFLESSKQEQEREDLQSVDEHGNQFRSRFIVNQGNPNESEKSKSKRSQNNVKLQFEARFTSEKRLPRISEESHCYSEAKEFRDKRY